MEIYDISLALKYGIKNNETKVKKVIKKKKRKVRNKSSKKKESKLSYYNDFE